MLLIQLLEYFYESIYRNLIICMHLRIVPFKFLVLFPVLCCLCNGLVSPK